MKIKHLPIAIAAMMLCACGGTNQNSGNNSTAPNENDTLSEYVAYQAYKLINPDSTADLPDYNEDKLTYTARFQIDEEVGQYASVNCYPLKKGGYLAVYSVEDKSVAILTNSSTNTSTKVHQKLNSFIHLL